MSDNDFYQLRNTIKYTRPAVVSPMSIVVCWKICSKTRLMLNPVSVSELDVVVLIFVIKIQILSHAFIKICKMHILSFVLYFLNMFFYLFLNFFF